jgi:YVTN family beta-propeller protein
VIPVGREPWEPYETPDHAKILVPNLADRTVSVIDVPSQKVLATLPGGKDMTGVVVTADSKKAYVVRRGDNKVSVIDLERLQVTGEIAVGRSPEVATRTASGKIYVANSGSGSVSVIDAGSDRVLKTISKVGKHPWALASFNGYNYCH